MEGLEITVLQKSELPNDNPKLRLDAQFQDRAILETVRKIRKQNFVTIGDLTGKSLRGKNVAYTEDGISPIVRSGDINQFFDSTNLLRSNETDDIFYLKNGDVLISSIGFGSIGKVQLYEHDEQCGVVSEVTVVRQSQFEPAFIAAFLSSKFGQYQIERFITGATGQLHLYPSDVDRIVLPDCSNAFQTHIAELYKASQQSHLEAKRLLALADQKILAALGLADWKPPEPLSYVASSKEAFASGRLDAQYFMPAKEQVRRALAAMPGKPLGERVNSIREMLVPNRAPNELKVRNYDVTDALTPILDATKESTQANEIGSTKKKFKNGDVVISRLRAYLKEIAVANTNDHIPLVGSSEFIVLRPNRGENKVSPETLMVFLRSAPVQTILKWCQDGSQHPRFSERDLLSIFVPDAVLDVSEEITSLVQDGFATRNKSHELLEHAKCAVEIAIEENKEAALAFLNANNLSGN